MSFRDYSQTPASNTVLGDGTFIGPNMPRNKVRPALQELAANGKELYDELSAAIGGIAVDGGIAISPMSFGAVGGGVVNDAAAVLAAANAAFAAGLPLDGGDTLYGVNGSLLFTGMARPWIRRLRLKQLDPASNYRTISFGDRTLGVSSACSSLRIDSLYVDVGNSPTVGDMDNYSGIEIYGGDGHQIGKLEATGQGKVTFIRIWKTTNSLYTGLHVHDGVYNSITHGGSPDVSGALTVADDRVQGIGLYDNYRCTFLAPRVHSLRGNATDYTQSGGTVTPVIKAFPNHQTRGISCGGNVSCTIIAPQISEVGQGMDLSGSGDGWANRFCKVIGANVRNCVVNAIKMANGPYGNQVSDCTAVNIGGVAYILTGNDSLYYAAGDTYSDCLAYNVGYNDYQFDTSGETDAHAGFWITGNGNSTAVGGVRLVGCRALDMPGVHLAGDDSPWALAGATSATMHEPWTGPNMTKTAYFTTSGGVVSKTVTLTNNSAAMTWTGGLANPVTNVFVRFPATMAYGFLNDAAYNGGWGVTLDPSCESFGHQIAHDKGFHRPYCEAGDSATQSIPSATTTVINFATETEDSLGMHDPSATPPRFYFKQPGRYRVTCFVEYFTNATGYRSLYLYKNNVTLLKTESKNATNGDLTSLTLIHEMDVTAADVSADVFVNFQTSQTSGGALNLNSNRIARVERLKAA